MATTILERCKISASDSKPDFSLPLVFFDMMWYELPIEIVLFFDFPCCKSDFLKNIIPDLKTSLSLTLSHFLPLSGKIIHPLQNKVEKPIVSYTAGDSVELIISESSNDFNYLTGDSPRECDKFYEFVPNLPPATHSKNSIASDVIAFQVTLFPEKGLSIGYISHHGVVDGSTIYSFIQAWALVHKTRLLGADYTSSIITRNNFLPYYDRKDIRNLNELLETRYLEAISWFSSSVQVQPPRINFPTNKFRSTFVIKKDEIQKMKNFVLAKCPNCDTHLSSSTIACALVWVCSTKSFEVTLADDEIEYFNISVDCRERLCPPLPANYFGNCVLTNCAKLKHGEVKGKDGFVAAAKAIGQAVKEINEKGILYIAEKWPEDYRESISKRSYWVWSAPSLDLYVVDYGWGKPNKIEILSNDRANADITLSKSREFEGGLEIGVSHNKVQMEAFAKLFNEVLSNCCAEKIFTRL